MTSESIVSKDEKVLITGASGFIGRYVVETLLDYGFKNLWCVVRKGSNCDNLIEAIDKKGGRDNTRIIRASLYVTEECQKIVEGTSLIYHLAASTGSKNFSDAYLNSVVITKNVLDAAVKVGSIRRIVNVSSFIVYSGGRTWRNIIDELAPVEMFPERRAQAYCYGKVKQDEMIQYYGKKFNLPYVIVRPGTVYGPGKPFLPGRIGIDSFGIFLHLGGPNKIPLTYVTNCAEAIVLAGLIPGIEGESFNIVDDDLPSSRQFLREYKSNVKNFKSIYIPHFLSYLLFLILEKFAEWSQGQFPPVYTRKEWNAIWKRAIFKNDKIKNILGWKQLISTREGLNKFFDYCRKYYENKINNN